MDLKLRFTDKDNVTYELTMGDSSLSKGYAKLKNILTGEEKILELSAITNALSVCAQPRSSEYTCGIH